MRNQENYSDGRAIRLGDTEGAVADGTPEQGVKDVCSATALRKGCLGVSAVGCDGTLELVCAQT